MKRICSQCGSEIPENAAFCGFCNTVTEEVLIEPPIEPPVVSEEPSASEEIPQPIDQPENNLDQENVDIQPKKKKKILRWLIPVAAILAVAIAAAFLWKPLMLRFAPHVYLGWTLDRTNADLQKRQEGGPLALLDVANDCAEKGTVNLGFDYSDSSSNDFSLDISVASNIEEKEWLTKAEITSEMINADLSLYMDSHHISAGSSLFKNGQHYGITYDSVKKDLRNSVFGENLTDDQIDAVAEFVELFEKTINSAGDMEALSKPYKELIENFFKDLKPEISQTKIAIDGKDVTCDTMTFEISHDQIITLLEDLLDLAEEDEHFGSMLDEVHVFDQLEQALNELDRNVEMDIFLIYHIYHNKVAAVEINGELFIEEAKDSADIELMIIYGTDASKNDIVIDVKVSVDGEDIEASIVSSVEKDDHSYEDILEITAKNSENERIEAEFSSLWNRDEGKLYLTFTGESNHDDIEFSVYFDLRETENGFEFGISDLYEWACGLNPDLENNWNPVDCSFMITFSKECNIKEPDYINLDKIGESDVLDFMSLISNFGT